MEKNGQFFPPFKKNSKISVNSNIFFLKTQKQEKINFQKKKKKTKKNKKKKK